jgi:hypothetical protein
MLPDNFRFSLGSTAIVDGVVVDIVYASFSRNYGRLTETLETGTCSGKTESEEGQTLLAV